MPCLSSVAPSSSGLSDTSFGTTANHKEKKNPLPILLSWGSSPLSLGIKLS